MKAARPSKRVIPVAIAIRASWVASSASSRSASDAPAHRVDAVGVTVEEELERASIAARGLRRERVVGSSRKLDLGDVRAAAVRRTSRGQPR